MDKKEKLLYWEDTSISVMEESIHRGHQIYFIEPECMFFRDRSLYAEADRVNASLNEGVKVLERNVLDLARLDVIFNRKEPPFDLSYLYLTQMLEVISRKVFIVNSPRGVRKANEKLYILEFPKWIPPTLVSNNPIQIERFQDSIKADLILKPLDQKGGTGICLLPRDAKEKRRILSQATSIGTKWIIAQKFLKGNLTRGDKRILLLNGQPMGQFQRIPKKGEFRSNLSLGGRKARARLSARERKMISSIRTKLAEDGLYFVGLDVVDGYLIEINVTSPAGIPEITELEGIHPERRVVDFFESEVSRLIRSRL